MARIMKSEEKHHARRVRSDKGESEMLLVAGGKRAYLWTSAGTYSGVVTLRTLAYDILREVGFNRKQK